MGCRPTDTGLADESLTGVGVRCEALHRAATGRRWLTAETWFARGQWKLATVFVMRVVIDVNRRSIARASGSSSKESFSAIFVHESKILLATLCFSFAIGTSVESCSQTD
jgi:hypothetical protein